MADYNDALNRNNPSVQERTKAQNRANVLQLKLIGQSHPTGLTANLLKLFEPRPPLEFKPPPEKRICPPYTGMAQFVSRFAEPTDPEYAPPVAEGETLTQRRARIRKLRLEEGARKAAEGLEKWNYDPSKDPTGDPYKTLFVARLNYETTEHQIKQEFETYGAIKRVRLVTDKETNKPRGYAFIEYVHTRDMKTAYKQADGRKLDNRRVLVDVERGRTVPNWQPRRLGGGLGTTRTGGEEVGQKHSTRDRQQLASGHSRSEELRARDDRHRDREKSRDRGRDREREHERSRELSHERARDPREDRHPHRDRERTRERGREKEKEKEKDRDVTVIELVEETKKGNVVATMIMNGNATVHVRETGSVKETIIKLATKEIVVILMPRILNIEVNQSTGGRGLAQGGEILFMIIRKNGTKSQEIMSTNVATASMMSHSTRNTTIILRPKTLPTLKTSRKTLTSMDSITSLSLITIKINMVIQILINARRVRQMTMDTIVPADPSPASVKVLVNTGRRRRRR